MPPCCLCGTHGRCHNCSCVKNGRSCSDCQPNRLDKCENQGSTITSCQPLNTRDDSPQDATIPITPADDRFDLPSFTPLSSPNFRWNNSIDSTHFIAMVDKAYQEVVHWRHNIFPIPTGKVGKEFVLELSRLF